VRVRGEVIVEAPIDVTWSALADIAGHVEWMADAESITFTSPQRTGIGTTFDCLTKVGPLTTTDKMTVTEWDELRAFGVRHSGIVVGSGVFELSALSPAATKVTWTEELRFPVWLGGAMTAILAKPVLRRIWRGNLRRFSTVVTSRYLKN
jgi:uncharacterized membrane protein